MRRIQRAVRPAPLPAHASSSAITRLALKRCGHGHAMTQTSACTASAPSATRPSTRRARFGSPPGTPPENQPSMRRDSSTLAIATVATTSHEVTSSCVDSRSMRALPFFQIQ